MQIFESLDALERLLDYHTARHNVLAANLSNAETPGYQPKDLVFSDALSQAETMQRTDPGHIGGAGGDLGPVEVRDDTSGMDANGVSLERQMAKLAANRLRYETGIELARRQIGLLRYAATDGGQT